MCAFVPLARNLHLADAHWIKINCFACPMAQMFCMDLGEVTGLCLEREMAA